MERKNYQNTISKEVLNTYKDVFMSPNERIFLSGLIKEFRPKKVLEVGVAAGGSSIIILESLGEDAKLYSHDYASECFRDIKIGYLVDKFPKLKPKWTFRQGGLCCKYLDEFCNDGEKFDMCILDTTHCNPGEFLDFLMVLPYLKENCVVVIHDISLFLDQSEKISTCCILLSALNGEKYLPGKKDDFCVNIGACKLSSNPMENLFDVFNCLRLKWTYNLSKDDINDVKKHFAKHYPSEYLALFNDFCNNAILIKKKNSILNKIKLLFKNLWI